MPQSTTPKKKRPKVENSWEKQAKILPFMIVLLGSPISTQHLYAQRGRVRYMRAEAKKLKASYVQQVMEQYQGDVLTGDLMIQIDLYWNDKRRRDRDNRHKLSMDCMEGIVFVDDRQIQQAIVSKYTWDTRIEILITVL